MSTSTIRSKPVLKAALFLLFASTTALPAQQCPELVFSDEFNGNALDASKWSHQLGDGCDVGLCGWGNNELQSYQSANAVVSDGTLKIVAREERAGNRNYTSARVRTFEKGDWTFGRFEARIQLPRGQGIWPAFWMMPTDEVYGGWPQSGEIDVMENIGREPATVHGNIHFGDPWPDNSSAQGTYELASGAFANRFHVFAVEREAGRIRWFVDGFLFMTRTTASTDPHTWPFDERFHFILNLAVGGDWPGSPDETTVFPQTLEVDYVRVYDRALPHVTGERQVAQRAAGTVYSVGNAAAGTTFSWTVPAGARIVSGQGTRSVTVDWGVTSGNVAVNLASRCGNRRLVLAVVARPPAGLDTPNELAAEVLTPTTAVVGWNDRSTAERVFDVQLRAGSGPWELAASVEADVTNVVLSRLSPGTVHRVRVRGRSSAGVSAWSRQLAFTLPELLGRPTPLRLTLVSPTTVRLVWGDRSDGEESFEVDSRLVPAGPWESLTTAGAGVTSVLAGDLAPRTVYSFRVRAAADGALSEWSPKPRIALPAQLGAPDGVRATVLTPSQVLLEWSDRSDGEETFEVQRRTAGPWEPAATAGAGAERAVLSRLASGAVYAVRVRAVSEGGLSEWSAVTTLTMPIELARPAPVLATALSSSSVRLTWTDRSDGEEAFEIRGRIPPEAWEDMATADAGVEQLDLSGLTPGATYVFRVRAVASGGLSNWTQRSITLPSE